MKKMVLAILLSSILTGCFNPDLTGVTVTCAPSDKRCPENSYCNDKFVCVPIPEFDLSAQSDMISVLHVDMSFSFTDVGTSPGLVIAVRGSFGKGSKSGMLPSEICSLFKKSTCTSKTIPTSDALCLSVGGFYFADVIGEVRPAGSNTCKPPIGGGELLFAGCSPDGIQYVSPMTVLCGMQTHYTGCSTNLNIVCGGQTLDSVASFNESNGILCC